MAFNPPSMEKISTELQLAPMMSRSASQVLEIMNDPDHLVGDVSRVIETDTALTAHILRVVNSAAFPLATKVDSLERAISYLGVNVIVGIAIGYCSSTLFNKPLEGYESAGGELWAHSLRTAIASREIARYARGELDANLGYTAGLLHDIGKAVVSKFLVGTAGEMLALIENGEAEDYIEAERSALGIDHCEAGRELAEMWGLPETLKEAIHYHHRPAQADEAHRALVYAVHLGEFVSMMAGIGTGTDCMRYQLDPGFSDFFDISSDTLQDLMVRVDDEFNRTKSALSGGGDEGVGE